jgi:hypothetical protein
MTVWFYLHLLGFVMWVGGALSMIVTVIASRTENRSSLAVIVRQQWAIVRALVLPGALLTVLSGLILTFHLMHSPVMGNGWMTTMQVLGMAAALVVLVVNVPTAARLTRIDPMGEHAAWFDKLRAKQGLFGPIAAVLALGALLGAAMYRYGS